MSTIVKSKHSTNFTVLPNEVFKSELSLSAIGLLAYLLSLPHDWIVYKTNLHLQLNTGREKLSSAFKDLQEKKYILSEKSFSEKTGKFEYKHTVYDKPYTVNPYTVKPSTAEPYTVNPLLLNKQLTKETLTKETLTKEKTFSFEDFIFLINTIMKKDRGFKGCSKSKRQFVARSKDGYRLEDYQKAIVTAMNQTNHKESNFMYLTPEFFTRQDRLEFMLNISNPSVIQTCDKTTIPVAKRLLL